MALVEERQQYTTAESVDASQTFGLSPDEVAHLQKHVGSQTLPYPPPLAWYAVEKQLLEENPSRPYAHAFWWISTGQSFAILLARAGYSFEDQCNNLKLYYDAVVPELGDGPLSDGSPASWQSFMTDHYCPLEFSWEWNKKDERPIVRFSFEPIGVGAGTAQDPFNEHATLRFVEKQNRNIQDCDLKWFRHFWDECVDFTGKDASSDTANGSNAEIADAASTHQSRAFLALEFNDTGLVLKTYFMPEFKARALGCSKMSLIHKAIDRLPDMPEQLRSAHRTLQNFLETNAQGRTMVPEIIATDCVEPSQSRIKIYMRSRNTSLESAIETLCLGRAEARESSHAALAEFGSLWNKVFGLPGGDATAELPSVDHRTGGILYYFSLQDGSDAPSVKVYLPVRHYGKSDVDSAAGLQKYIRTTKMHDYTQDYLDAVLDIRRSSIHAPENGLQSYFTCALKGDALRLTSYLAPKVYK